MRVDTDPSVQAVYDAYPTHIRPTMLSLRDLIIDTADSLERLDLLHETLKWGVPSYITKYGSTLRMDWKAKKSEYSAMYFNCKSQLVPTFRMIYPDMHYEGSRALLVPLSAPIPTDQLRQCIKTYLVYHKVKHLPMLGM